MELQTIASDAEILQMHYYLENDSHSIDAFSFNKAENELLKIIDEISQVFDVEIIVETEALQEGGIRANYKFKAKKNSKNLSKDIKTFLISVTSAVLGGYATHYLTTDPKQEKLDKEKTRLEILHLRSQIKNDTVIIANDSNKDVEKNEDHSKKDDVEEDSTPANVDSIAEYISERNKIKIHRSNFYRVVLDAPKVIKVSTQALNSKQKPVSEERTVVREKFNDFIINSSRIDNLYDENATIEIVSPVLNDNPLNWKGIYNGNLISFKMKDQDFRDLIISKNLKFVNGTKLNCIVEIKRKINKEGEITYGAKSIYDVTQILYPDGDTVDVLLT